MKAPTLERYLQGKSLKGSNVATIPRWSVRALPLASLVLVFTACTPDAPTESTTGGGNANAAPATYPPPTATPTAPPSTLQPSPIPEPEAATPPPTPLTPPPPPPPREWSDIVQLDCTNAAADTPVVNVVAERDLTGDGAPEVFLVSECQASTSSWPQVLSIYDGAAGTSAPRRLQTLLDYGDGEDDRCLREIQILDLSEDTLMVGALAYLEEDGNCCPSMDVTTQYVWTGSEYALTSRDASEVGTGD